MAFDERVLNGMGVLCAIVDSGSFVGAGDALGMSQSGVSRAVSRLEARLGVRLFDRTTRSVTLTDEGRRLVEQVVPLLAGLEQAAATAADGGQTVRGRLRVNIDPFFSRLFLGPRLGGFMQAHPDLELELVTRDQLGDLVAEGFDLAVRFGQPRASTLVARPLLDTRILTVASPAYLKRYGPPTHPSDLERGAHTCIHFRDPETGRPFEWEFHQRRKILKVAAAGRLTVNDVATLHGVCLAGYGIAQVMELGAEAMVADGRLVPLLTPWQDERFPLYALYPSRQYMPAKVRAFLDFVGTLSDTRAVRPMRGVPPISARKRPPARSTTAR